MSNRAVSRTIILCAGAINYSNLPIGTSQSNAMVPVNGKPVIGWILDDLLTKGIRDVTIVLRKEDERLSSFLRRSYTARMEIDFAGVDAGGSIVHSLFAGLKASHLGLPVRLILGDTLIRDTFESELDFVYVAEVDDPRRWCLVDINQDSNVVSYTNKSDSTVSKMMLALAGYYHFLDGKRLYTTVEECLFSGATELSQVLERYGVNRQIKAVIANDWYDFGSIDNLVAARHRLIQSRHFNSLQIDAKMGTITKRSVTNEQKLVDEICWYLQLPEELKILSPRILEYSTTRGSVALTQEYYGYPTLAELSLYANLSTSIWRAILMRLFDIHDTFRRYTGEVVWDDVSLVYSVKTLQRMSDLANQSANWKELLNTNSLIINGKRYLNLPMIESQLRSSVDKLASNCKWTIIHGDYCFSNILFDISSQVVRLVDPRGSFGSVGIYGDPRYDVAKLRHSVCGLYDHIVADMFEVRGNRKEGFEIQIFVDDAFDAVGKLFDLFVIQWGYNDVEIRLVEALLFVSMVPLHKDNPKRQLIMYLTGIRLLNEVFECVSS